MDKISTRIGKKVPQQTRAFHAESLASRHQVALHLWSLGHCLQRNYQWSKSQQRDGNFNGTNVDKVIQSISDLTSSYWNSRFAPDRSTQVLIELDNGVGKYARTADLLLWLGRGKLPWRLPYCWVESCFNVLRQTVKPRDPFWDPTAWVTFLDKNKRKQKVVSCHGALIFARLINHPKQLHQVGDNCANCFSFTNSVTPPCALLHRGDDSRWSCAAPLRSANQSCPEVNSHAHKFGHTKTRICLTSTNVWGSAVGVWTLVTGTKSIFLFNFSFLEKKHCPSSYIQRIESGLHGGRTFEFDRVAKSTQSNIDTPAHLVWQKFWLAHNS